jgi:hypothetical protein
LFLYTPKTYKNKTKLLANKTLFDFQPAAGHKKNRLMKAVLLGADFQTVSNRI